MERGGARVAVGTVAWLRRQPPTPREQTLAPAAGPRKPIHSPGTPSPLDRSKNNPPTHTHQDLKEHKRARTCRGSRKTYQDTPVEQGGVVRLPP